MWISRSATAQAARLIPGWERYADVLARLSIGPDLWKSEDPSEGPRHFIDLEQYGWPAVPLDPDHAGLYDLQTGTYTDIEGIAPWIITDAVDRMSSAMRTNNWKDAIRIAGAVGHYAADLCMPLHTTSNFDGMESGNDGIHARWESELSTRKMKSRRFADSRPAYLATIWPAVTSALVLAHGYVPDILNADYAASGEADYSENDMHYYDVLWLKTKDIFIGQIDRAAHLLASLWYTAWVNAGSPAVPPPPADGISFDSIYPRTAGTANSLTQITTWVGLTLLVLASLFIVIISYRRKP